MTIDRVKHLTIDTHPTISAHTGETTNEKGKRSVRPNVAPKHGTIFGCSETLGHQRIAFPSSQIRISSLANHLPKSDLTRCIPQT
jgi:hypothetical protein